MSMAQVLRTRFPRASANLRRYSGSVTRPLDEAGRLGWFAVIGGRDMAWAVTRYRKEILRLIAEIGMGTGAMAVVGGTAVIIAFVSLSAGSLVAIQGLASLGHIGLQTLLGFLAAFINVRLVAPIVTGIALAATVGAGATAELGAMRISEEIDALEVMGIKSMAYLVSTRALAGLVVIYRGLEALPKEKIGQLLDETAQSVGGLGPALQRLVDSTQAIVGDFRTNIRDVDDIIQNSAPILDSQATSSPQIERWARNLNVLGAQAAEKDQNLRDLLPKAAPTADDLNAVFNDVRDSLPQTLANLSVVIEMLKRYHAGVEQVLVLLPQAGSIIQTISTPYEKEHNAVLDLGVAINQPPPCLTGWPAAAEWRSPADVSLAPLPEGAYCKIPQETPANVVRGARNIPCVDVPGKRAATPKECRSNKPYEPAGTNPWYGDPNQILNCPAPGARCDQPVNPGQVRQAPSINNGLNPLPASKLPPGGQTPPPISDPLQRPGSGTVQCNGQQPNPCIYTPGGPPTAVYSPQSGEVTGPDGVKYSVNNSSNTGDDGWKEMLAPAG